MLTGYPNLQKTQGNMWWSCHTNLKQNIALFLKAFHCGIIRSGSDIKRCQAAIRKSRVQIYGARPWKNQIRKSSMMKMNALLTCIYTVHELSQSQSIYSTASYSNPKFKITVQTMSITCNSKKPRSQLKGSNINLLHFVHFHLRFITSYKRTSSCMGRRSSVWNWMQSPTNGS